MLETLGLGKYEDTLVTKTRNCYQIAPVLRWLNQAMVRKSLWRASQHHLLVSESMDIEPAFQLHRRALLRRGIVRIADQNCRATNAHWWRQYDKQNAAYLQEFLSNLGKLLCCGRCGCARVGINSIRVAKWVKLARYHPPAIMSWWGDLRCTKHISL